VRIVSNRHERERYVAAIFAKVGYLLVTMGILGLIWFFFTYEQIPLLGARFWFLVWLLGVVAWVLWILRFTYKQVPSLRQRDKDRIERRKYFPPRKKKKKFRR